MYFRTYRVFIALCFIALCVPNDMLVEAFDDAEDYSKGLTEYLSLMSAGLQKVVGGGHAGLTTIHMKSMVKPEVDPQFRKRKDVHTPEGEAVLKSLDLQARYMDNDLGEKNLMWSLRGSQSEEKLRDNLQSADTTMFRRRLAEIGQSWISQLFRNAYPVYSRSSMSKLETVEHGHHVSSRGKTTHLHVV